MSFETIIQTKNLELDKYSGFDEAYFITDSEGRNIIIDDWNSLLEFCKKVIEVDTKKRIKEQTKNGR